VHREDPLVPIDNNDGEQLMNQAVFDALLAASTDNSSLAHDVSAQQHPEAKRAYCQDERQQRESARTVRREKPPGEPPPASE